MERFIANSNKDVRRLAEWWERGNGSKPLLLWTGKFFVEKPITEELQEVTLDWAEAELVGDYELLVCIRYKDYTLMAMSQTVFVGLQERKDVQI